MKNQEPTRGRPPLPKGTAATSQIQLRVQTKRKAAYVRAANKKGQTLAEWCFDHLDAASGYEDPEGKGNETSAGTGATGPRLPGQ
jgi:hypothetical protein